MNIESYWSAVFRQDGEAMGTFFHRDAVVVWHNTRERFSVEEFIRVNCAYPGSWDGEMVRVDSIADGLVSVVRVFEPETGASFHVTSFMTLEDDLIVRMDEFWGEDEDPPSWRLEMKMGEREL